MRKTGSGRRANDATNGSTPLRSTLLFVRRKYENGLNVDARCGIAEGGGSVLLALSTYVCARQSTHELQESTSARRFCRVGGDGERRRSGSDRGRCFMALVDGESRAPIIRRRTRAMREKLPVGSVQAGFQVMGFRDNDAIGESFRSRVAEAEIPVMGHVERTARSVGALRGLRMLGKSTDAPQQVRRDARPRGADGAFSAVRIDTARRCRAEPHRCFQDRLRIRSGAT
jgi:hypothetical protein